MVNDEAVVDKSWLTQHIRQNIPLSEAMQFEVLSLDNTSIEVAAPLEPNINIHGTGFAGSLYSLAVLTAWGLTNVLAKESGVLADVVVSQAEIKYRRPVKTAIHCACICSPEMKFAFIEALQTKGKGNLLLNVTIGNAGEALLIARMVAIRHR